MNRLDPIALHWSDSQVDARVAKTERIPSRFLLSRETREINFGGDFGQLREIWFHGFRVLGRKRGICKGPRSVGVALGQLGLDME